MATKKVRVRLTEEEKLQRAILRRESKAAKDRMENEQIFNYWNSKKIVEHRKISHDMKLEMDRIRKHYEMNQILEAIDFYATILEPGTEERDKKYYWNYKWNLRDFLARGVRKFDGMHVSDFLRKQTLNKSAAEAIVFKRG